MSHTAPTAVSVPRFRSSNNASFAMRCGQIEKHARTRSVIHTAYRLPSKLLTMVVSMAVQPSPERHPTNDFTSPRFFNDATHRESCMK